MHYAVRLKVGGKLDSSTGLPPDAKVTRGVVTEIDISGDFGLLDLTPLQTPPADKPLFLQCLAVDLLTAGTEEHSIEAVDFDGGPSFVVMNLDGVTSRIDTTGWVLPVGYKLRFTGPDGAPVGSTEKHYIRLDFWQIENLAEVVASLRGSGGSSVGNITAIPSGPAGGDLTGVYPNPYVSALRSGDTSLNIGSLTAGQYLKRDESLDRIVSAPAPSYNGTNATGDLSGQYPSPTVTALHTSDGVRHAIGAASTGQYLTLAADGTIRGVTPISTTAGGDLAGTYPSPTVTALHTYNGAARYDIDNITAGQYLMLSSGGRITGGTPSGGTSVFGQGYNRSTIANVMTSTQNWTQVITLAIPAIVVGQTWRLSWSAEMLIESGTDWGVRIIRTDTSAILSPNHSTYNQFLFKNLQQGWQVPYSGILILNTAGATFPCALQIRCSTGEHVWARNALMEIFRVS